MSRRNKLLKFAELATFPNVYENFSVQEPQLLADHDTPVDLKGKWASEHFKNGNPITLELACGRGEYTVGLARQFPDRNFIGVDVKGARIWKGARQALADDLDNAAFLRTRIECVEVFFESEEIDEIWITFPDPFPRDRQVNRRLTAPIFLDLYRGMIKPDGIVHLKTDNTGIFLYTLSVIVGEGLELVNISDDVDALDLGMQELDIPTYYERLHRDKGSRIKYCAFRL